MASALKEKIHARLREIFGEPDDSLGRDDHWSLKPGPDMPAINLLVNGTADTTAIWVFDPHAKDDGVLRTAVKDMNELESMIKKIRQRVDQAAKRHAGG